MIKYGNKFTALLTASALAIVLGACSKEGHDDDHKHATKDSHGGHEVHWSYSGDGAPAKWASLKEDFATCDAGMKQSPINIQTTSATAEALPPITVDYKATAIDLVNNGHTIQQNYPAGSSITVGGKKFNLLQFHFHSPSEHTIDGKPADMVAHQPLRPYGKTCRLK